MSYVKVAVECPEGHFVKQTSVNPDAVSNQGTMMCPVCKRRFTWRNERGTIRSSWL